MSNVDVAAIARELMTAHETGEMLASPLSSRPGFDLDAAYAVENALKGWREESGHKSVGRKVGYANKAVWRILKLDTLVWGHMYDDTIHQASGNSAKLHISRPRSLKIEPEIMFGMKAPITSQVSDAAAALGAVAWIALGFEIIDCPYPDWKFQPSDFVASFGLHAGLVVGERIPVQSDRIPALVEELSRFKLRMMKGGELVEEGSAKNCLRSPALCLAELGSAILQRFPEEPLREGEIVSSGTLTAGHLTQAGDRWTAELDGLSLPPLTLELT
jgi:2-oxo-3-hexenedioate decarboxylase